MISLLGQCYGLVKNTQIDVPDNLNCNWKSGDPNYELAVLPEDGVKQLIQKFAFIFEQSILTGGTRALYFGSPNPLLHI
jgi:hypothetical protein